MQPPTTEDRAYIPSGTITFLFTDIEGSSRMWEQDPAAARHALRTHDAIVIDGVQEAGGVVVKARGEGDSHFAVFAHAADAVQAAVSIQKTLAATAWSTPQAVRVRMALHSGEAELRAGDYYGRTVNRCARIRAAGHGGQILLSRATADLVRDQLPDGAALRDLGLHRLKDLSEPEQLYQVDIPGLPAEFPALNSLNLVTHNLPAQPTSFVGREREVQEVTGMLAGGQARLITLTGPGGTGKTRLSLQVGAEMIGRYADGVFYIPLAEATSAELIISKTARELEVREGGNQALLATLKTFLRDKQLLLIMDNLEQVVDAAGVVAELLAEAPRLQIIATSRALLNLRGEFNYPVPTLSLPAPDSRITRESLAQNEATRLFIERATAVNPRLVISPQNAPLIAEICRRLEGLPLAIELAAARVRLLSLDALLARLSARLDLLVGGARDLPQRQQTLRGAIDWSFELLAEQERRLLARLSVFAGGFTLEAAEAVCAIDGDLDVLNGLEALLAQSMLRQQELAGGSIRFYLLEAIREYASEKLVAYEETTVLLQRHMAYFAQQMQVIGFTYYTRQAVAALDWTDQEHDNLRAVLARSLDSSQGRELLPDLALGLSWYWYRRGFVTEGREWAERTLAAHAGESRTLGRAKALWSCGAMAMWQGDLHAALAYSEEAVAITRWLEEPLHLASALMVNAIVQVNMGNDLPARDQLIEALAIYSQLGFAFFEAVTRVHLANASLGLGDFAGAGQKLDEAMRIGAGLDEPWLNAFALNNRGEVARTQGRYDDARAHYVASERLLREVGDTGDLARLVHTLGYIDLHEGHFDRAGERFRESLAMFLRVGNQRGIAECLAGLAGLLARQDKAAEGAELLAAAAAIQEASGAAWWPADRVEIERNTAVLRAALGEERFAAAQDAGRRLTIDQAIAAARGPS